MIAGPSGVGKGTIVRRLLEQHPSMWLSVSATTRPPRKGEVDGREYVFLTPEEFEARHAAGDFLEAFEVFDARYGTPRRPVEEHLAAGNDVVLEIDVQGALAVNGLFPDAALVFIKPPSPEVLRERLLARDPTADAAELERRLAEADDEEALAGSFDLKVVNDEVDRAVDEIERFLDNRR